MAVSTHETRFILTAKDKTKVAFKGVKGSLRDTGMAVGSLQGKLFTLAGIGGLGGLVGSVISTSREFQNLESSLETAEGSAEKGQLAFDKMKKFAKSTPYDLKQVTKAYIMMKNLGLEPTEKALTALGNTASAQNKPLMQMIEAAADASSGEFERLKEFGIKAKKQGDSVALTFQGITTTIKNNSGEIMKYLTQIGESNFKGAMEKKMNGLDAAFSNLGGAFDEMKVMIGKAGLSQYVTDIAHGMTEFMESMDKEQIEAFVKSGVNGLDSIFKSVKEMYNFIEGNKFLQAAGILGYMFYGKWGVAGALAVDKGAEFIGKADAKAWERNNPSQITGAGNADFNQFKDGYRIGDFNRSNGSLDSLDHQKNYDAMRDSLADKYAPENIEALKKSFETQNNTATQSVKLQEKTNSILEKTNSILESGSLGVAVAG